MEVFVFFVALSLTGLLTAWRHRARLRLRTPPLRRAPTFTRAPHATDRAADLAAAADEAHAEMDRLVRADRDRVAFLTGLSHALRSQLNIAHGLTQAMKHHVPIEPLTWRQETAVEGMLAATTALTALTDAIRDFIPGDDLLVTRLDPQLVIRDVCMELAETAMARGVELRCPPPTAGVAVMADAGALRRILRRLISNAILFNRRNGAVLIEVRQAGEDVTLFVHDTGCGIAPERLPTLLRPFDGPAGDPNLGPHLGLPAAAALAQTMGGILSVNSQESQGSTFALHLPTASHAHDAASPFPALPGPLPHATLLYVDGAPSGVALMKKLLPVLGPVTLHLAPCGEEGLALTRALRPDAVIVDMDLPDMDGFELKARLDADGLTRDIPVIAVSAAALAVDLRRSRAAGFAACLVKPIDIPALHRALEAVLPGHDPRQAAA